MQYMQSVKLLFFPAANPITKLIIDAIKNITIADIMFVTSFFFALSNESSTLPLNVTLKNEIIPDITNSIGTSILIIVYTVDISVPITVGNFLFPPHTINSLALTIVGVSKVNKIINLFSVLFFFILHLLL